ncbi:NAD(P)/FAD-dependent oxidoreductase [Agrococcus sp. KRD186]|uniref:NAD(P)/FAD-dependent oxidoreductase n=1 Tax=Agrococcus sp. KRD186 TaxID=2729730 RepID=UPI0019D10A7E|nr:FAD-dependent oxidoreductase [Agrococcus sp. KRD186]
MSTPLSPDYQNGNVSFWRRTLEAAGSRPALPGDATADVVIVGGGYTGMWTAFYLKQQAPDMRIVVLESETVGYGASGRNGGWLSGEFGGSQEKYAAESSPAAVSRMQAHLVASIDEVITIAGERGIDAEIAHDGLVYVATTLSQAKRLQHKEAHQRAWGRTPDDFRILSPNDGRPVNVHGATAFGFSPHGARINPAKLVAGLAREVEAMGVRIYEHTPVTEVQQGGVMTTRSRVRAETVLIATEGFTAGLPGRRRDWLPMNSVMIVTEPLSDAAWSEIDWRGDVLLGSIGHVFMYAQRTPDGRIAIGGRGNPYRFGSKTDTNAMARPEDVDALWKQLTTFFPAVRDSKVAHSWCGTLGVARDWCATVAFDPSTGIGHSGGYAGHGVALAHLGGRTLAELVLGEQTERTALPLVNRRIRKWEPEPLRWIGAQLIYGLYRQADRRELHGSARSSFLGTAADRISGR